MTTKRLHLAMNIEALTPIQTKSMLVSMVDQIDAKECGDHLRNPETKKPVGNWYLEMFPDSNKFGRKP